MKPRIYVFINAGAGTEYVEGAAVAEDGIYLAGHVSSSEDFFRFDMGLVPSNIGTYRKHDIYDARYPDGYELIEGEPPADLVTHADRDPVEAAAS